MLIGGTLLLIFLPLRTMRDAVLFLAILINWSCVAIPITSTDEVVLMVGLFSGMVTNIGVFIAACVTGDPGSYSSFIIFLISSVAAIFKAIAVVIGHIRQNHVRDAIYDFGLAEVRVKRIGTFKI